MKVIQVLPALNGGGVEKGTLEVAKFLTDNGHESVVVSAGGSMVPLLEAEGSRHVVWDLGRKSLLTFRHIWSFRRFLLNEQADVLHLRSRMPAWIAYLAWKGLPVQYRPKLVTTVHGLYSVSKYSQIMCKGEAVIAVSDTVRDYILDNYPTTPPERIHRIYRGVDPEDFPYGYQPSSEWQEHFFKQYPNVKGKRILCLPGRLTRLKGHHDFIDLMVYLLKHRDDVHGLIVGGEDPKRKEYAQELYRRVKSLGLESQITFTGARSDIKDIFAISDIVYSLSSKPESFGRTVLEALRLNRPVVGYAHGGVGEILNKFFIKGAVTLKDLETLQNLSFDILDNVPTLPETTLFTKQEMLRQTQKIYEY